MNKMRETSCRGGHDAANACNSGLSVQFHKKMHDKSTLGVMPPQSQSQHGFGLALHNAWGVTRFYGLSQPSGVKHAGKSAGQKSTKIHIRQKLSGRTNAMAGMRGNDSAGFPELPPGLCRDMLRISSVLFMLQQLHSLAK